MPKAAAQGQCVASVVAHLAGHHALITRGSAYDVAGW